MKLRSIRFHEPVNVDGAMLDRAEAGEACAFGVVVGADATLVPWTNVRWAKRADEPAVDWGDGSDPLNKPLHLNPNAQPPVTFGKRAPEEKRRRKGET